MEAYLDNSATTQCYESVATIMTKVLCEDYGNPSSLHTKGLEAERYVKQGRSIIAKSLKAKDKEIIYTSGGTESNNLAILGAVYGNCRIGRHIITTQVEHPATMETMKYLEEEGFHVTYLPVDAYGVISLKELQRAIMPDTIFISVMYVNNEMGAVQPIEEIGKFLLERGGKTIFHVDAIQAYGKYGIYPSRCGIDLMSVSGHKIHGPKGVGFLYVREGVKIRPITYGGGQQKGMRSGTENVAGIAGLAEAVRIGQDEWQEVAIQLRTLKKMFVEGLNQLENVTVNGHVGEGSAPHIVSVSFLGIRSEVLLHALEEKGIYVSAGSACASNHPTPSKTLQAMKVSKGILESTIRFSFSSYTTEEEIRYTLEALYDMIPMLRKYTRR